MLAENRASNALDDMYHFEFVEATENGIFIQIVRFISIQLVDSFHVRLLVACKSGVECPLFSGSHWLSKKAAEEEEAVDEKDNKQENKSKNMT